MFAQRFTNECGTIQFGATRGLIGGVQKLFIENNLDCFHMSTLFHSILHNIFHQVAGTA